MRATLRRLKYRAYCRLLRIHGSLRPRRVIVYYRHASFSRKSEAFADLLRRRGFDAQVRTGVGPQTRALLESSSDLWIGFWNEFPVEFLPRNYIFVNTEPLNVAKWNENADWRKAMAGAREVWGYTRSNAQFVERLGVPFHHVPCGYAPYYETIFRRHTDGKMLPQDIDVLFFGWISMRRGRILDEIGRRGMNVHVARATNQAYGAELDELLARAKIVLGIHYFDEPEAQIADLARVDHPLSNRLFVIHERPSPVAADPEFEQNVTTCEYGDIPDTCARFLAQPEERARRAAWAQEWFKSRYSLDDFIPYDRVRGLLARK